MKIKLSEEQAEEAVSIYLCNDISAKDVGFIFGVSESLIFLKIKKLGLKKDLSEFKQNLEQALNFYISNDVSIEKASKTYGIAHSTLKKHLNDKNLTKETKKNIIKEEVLEEAISVYLCNSISVIDIAYIFGISGNFLQNTFRSLGLMKKSTEFSRKIPITEYTNIINEYQKTKSIVELAKKYNVSASCIEKILKKNKVRIYTRKDKRIINEDQEKEIIARYLSGENITSIAKDFSITVPGLRRYFERNGITTTRRSCLDFLSEEDKLDIINMYKNPKFFIEDIYSKYKLSSRGLTNLLQQNNIAPRQIGNIYSRGISGYYKNIHFRSLLELCFIGQVLMVKYKNDEWRSGESKHDRIRYKDTNGKERWYYPDFIIKDKIVIEIKPECMFLDPTVLLKTEAAQNYCAQNNKKFILINMKIDLNFVKKELDSKNIEIPEKQLRKLENKLRKLK